MFRYLLAFMLLLPAALAHALEPPPIHLRDLYGEVHGGFDRIGEIELRSDGRVYISDMYHHRVVVYSADGRYLEQIGSYGSALGEFNVPTGLAFDNEGNLFVTHQAADRITKLSPSHLPLMTFGSSGTGPGQMRGADILAMSPDGTRLYVTELFGDRVSMFDTNGNFLGSFGQRGTGPGQFDHPSTVVVDASGDVFVSDQYNHRVQRFTATGTFLDVWGGLGSAPGQFNLVVGLGLDAADNDVIYATDQLNNRCQKLRKDGTPLAVWGTFGSGPGEMYNPWVVQPMPNGEIWVGDTFNHRISIYGPQSLAKARGAKPDHQSGRGEKPAPLLAPESNGAGTFAGCLDPAPSHIRDLHGEVHGGFDRVNQMARRDDGRIYIGDMYHNRIVVYSSDGRYLEQFGTFGTALGEIDLASGLVFDAGSNLFVTNQHSDRITKFSPTHLPLMNIGSSGTGPGQLSGPDDIACSPDGTRLYVNELFADRVSIFDTGGNFLGSFGQRGTGPGQFDKPSGIAVSAANEVFVADQYNHRVERFDAAGAYISEWGGFGSAPGKFNLVCSLALDEDGNLYAADQLNNRIQKLRQDGTPLLAWGSFGSGPGQMYNPWTALPLPNGEIWVGDTFNYRISIYGPNQGGAGPEPHIVSIEDVPHDDGYQVRINFLASNLDVSGSSTPITQYEAYRRIDSANQESHASPSLVAGIAASAIEATLSGETTLLAGWEFVGSVPAHAESEYNIVAPTLVNSRRNRNPRYSVFFIRAATHQPATYFDSCPDSGSSVDNLPPRNPRGFTAQRLANDNLGLDWEANQEQDFLGYSLHRGSTSDFVPTNANKLADLAEPGYTDHAAPNGPVYYKLSAWDTEDNESGFSLTSPEGLVDVSGGLLPTTFDLYAAIPNPMSTTTSFQFDLPIRSAVTIRIFDLHGRMVGVLGEGMVMSAGRYRWDWNGRDAGGSRVPSGVYFYRLTTPSFSKTRRVVVNG